MHLGNMSKVESRWNPLHFWALWRQLKTCCCAVGQYKFVPLLIEVLIMNNSFESKCKPLVFSIPFCMQCFCAFSPFIYVAFSIKFPGGIQGINMQFSLVAVKHIYVNTFEGIHMPLIFPKEYLEICMCVCVCVSFTPPRAPLSLVFCQMWSKK